MTNIIGENIVLRAVEPADVKSLYEWENDTSVWGVSGTTSPFSHHTLSLFIEAQREDIFTSRQMRLMICARDSALPVGALDLFEFDPLHRRAGVGIMIASQFRHQGYAADALATLERYATEQLHIHQLWCNIEATNQASLALFTKAGYQHIGTKKEWNITPAGYCDEMMLQKLL